MNQHHFGGKTCYSRHRHSKVLQVLVRMLWWQKGRYSFIKMTMPTFMVEKRTMKLSGLNII